MHDNYDGSVQVSRAERNDATTRYLPLHLLHTINLSLLPLSLRSSIPLSFPSSFLPSYYSGTAEIFGCELVPGKEYAFHDTKLAAFTWYGAVLETSESEGVSLPGGGRKGGEGGDK